MINISLIPKIEKALSFTLNEMQIKYLTTNERCTWNGRKSGYTTAYIVNLALNTKIEIKLSDLRKGKYNDEKRDINYNYWFKQEFGYVRDLLEIQGLNVVKISTC